MRLFTGILGNDHVPYGPCLQLRNVGLGKGQNLSAMALDENDLHFIQKTLAEAASDVQPTKDALY